MFQIPKLKDVLDDPFDSIFSTLDLLEVPWADLGISTDLDLFYVGNRSGGKYVSPMINLLLEDGKLTNENLLLACSTAVNIFGTAWERQYATLSLEYDPISNYDMEERETPAETTDTETPAEVTRTRTPQQEKVTNARVDSIYGYNTTVATASPSGSSEGTSQNEVIADEVIKDTTDTAGTRVHTVDNERVLTRKGNIGVTTSQQMVESEHALWRWNFFLDVVFPDLDKIFCAMIY